MAPARRLPVDSNEPEGASSSASQSGIQLKESTGSYRVIDLRIPRHDPLPRIAYDDDVEEEESGRRPAKKVMIGEPLPTVTSASGIPIAIAASAASVDLLSSRPPSNEASAPVLGEPTAHEPDDLERIIRWLPLHVAVFVVVLLAVIMFAHGYFG